MMKNLKLTLITALIPTLITAQETVVTLNTDHSGTSHNVVARNTIFLKPGFSYFAAGDDSLWAHIEPDLSLPPITDVACMDPSQFPQDINTLLPVGTIPGQAGVSATGAANYTIPIEVPPGTQGMQPNLSVAYNSQAGNGMMGMGWNLAGLSAITRVPKNIYNDGIVEEIMLDATDNFALDGNRLILTAGNQGAANSEYHTEIETYVKITAQENSGSGPKWFKVETKEGLTIYFGNSGDSRVIGKNNTVIAWKINRIEDQHSNYMVFEYRTDDDEQPVSKIKYTGNTTDGKEPYNTIQFNYVKRNDVNTTWPAHKQITADLLLENIEIISEGAFVRKYEFGYVCDFYSRLESVKLTGSELVALNETSFKYGDTFDNPSTNFDYVATNLLAPEGGGQFVIGDFNGDGYSDVMDFPYYDGYETYFKGYRQITNAKNNMFEFGPSGFFDDNFRYKTMHSNFGPDPTNSLNFTASDFNGDGRDDFTVFEFNTDETQMNKAIIYYSTETGFSSTDYQTDINYNRTNSDENSFVTGDFDGDGTIDFMTFLNNGSNYKTEIFFPRRDERMFINTLDGINTSKIANAEYLFVIDFDGDGKDDLMVVNGDDIDATTIYSFKTNPISTETDILYRSGYPTKWHKVFPGDFNGDGKTDLLSTGNNIDWYIGTNNGNYFVEKPFTFFNTIDPNDSQGHKIVLGDYNSDGKTDIVHAHNYHRGYVHAKQTDIYLYNGNEFIFISDTDVPIFNYLSRNLFCGDFNGDGKNDLVNMRDYDSELLVELIYLSNSNQHFRLNSVYYGQNSVASFTYKPITDNSVYTKGNEATYPVVDIQVPVNVVQNFASPNGVGGATTMSYFYENAKLHLHGKGFLGFISTTVNNSASGFKSINVYKNETGLSNYCFEPMTQSTSSTSLSLTKTLYHPLLTKSIILDSNNDTISKVIYNNKIEITDPCLGLDYELFYINPESTIEKDYLNSLVTTTNYTYDEYGNPTNITVNYNGDASTETINTYTSFGSWWCPKSRIGQSTVTQTRGGDSFTDTTDFVYNNKGALTGKTSFSGLQKAVTEAWPVFDNFGNPKAVSVSAATLETRSSSMEYDTYGRFVTKTTNPLGHTEQFTYDGKTGNLLIHTDVNGLSTTREYDGFGRLKKITYPDLNTTVIDHQFDISGNQLFYIKETTGGQPEQKTWYDRLGRTMKTSVNGYNNTIYTQTQYNTKGELWKVSEPYTGSPSQYTTYHYFDDGRIDYIDYPTGVTDNFTYTEGSTETTFTSSNGMHKTTVTDGAGTLTSVTDNGGQITYSYFAHGGVKDINYSGSTISMTYDEYGRQTGLSEPDAGPISYTYNAYGELENQTDARGNSYTMAYDKLGRLTEKKLGGATVATYTYDNAPGKGIGLQASVAGNNNISYSYEYDNLSRLIKTTENIQGKTFTTETGYNATSQLNKIIHPNGYTIDNNYQNAYLSSVNGTYLNNTTGIFSNPSYNQRGQVTHYTMGNGLPTTRGYNEFGFPTSIITPGIQNLEYEFDVLTGNLNQRTDNLNTLTETFTYDNLVKNRLATWQVNSATPDTVNYLANGNIGKKTGLGNYAYGSPRPHAVTQVENTGNLVSATPDTISYTPFNKVATIEEGDFKLVFTYGPDQRRKKTELYEKKGQNWKWQKSKYFAGSYELEVEGQQQYERHLNYIYGADGLAAIHEVDNNAPGLYYIYKDHLGSYQAITDIAGTKIDSLSFDPWGNRRNPADWSYPTPQTGFLFDRGFTGHEHLCQFNLINMNDRVYDPLLGRFLSPDNYVQLPDYTQSLNRYSYALNNPLVYIDPDGEFWQFLLNWGIATLGNYAIGGMDRWINKGMSFNDAFFNPNYITAGASVNFSPGNFNSQNNFGFSHPQVDAYNLVQNELEFEQRYDRWEYTQRGRGRKNPRGIFGTNHELGPVGIGINLELALPEWLPYATHNTGFSLSFGLVADSKDNLDFYVTEGTPTKNNVAFSLSPEIFYVESRSRQIYNRDIEGFSNQFSLGIGIVGGSVSSNPSISYRQWTLTGLGSGIDINTGSWETYTRLYKIYGR